MSDEQRRQGQQTAQAAQAGAQAATTGDRWDDPISEERQAELQGYLVRWQAESDHGERKGPFDWGPGKGPFKRGVPLTGADVFWLAEQSGRDQDGRVPKLHLEGANLYQTRLEGATLGGAWRTLASKRRAWSTPASARRIWRAPTSPRRTWRGPSSTGPAWSAPAFATRT